MNAEGGHHSKTMAIAAVATLFLLVPTAGVGVYQIVRWWTEHGVSFTATAERHAFELPPPIRWKFEGVQIQTRETSTSELLKEAEDRKRYLATDEFLTVSLRNSGERPATNVRLLIGERPEVGMAYIKWDDGRTDFIEEFRNEIQLGDVPVEKSANISVWTIGSGPSKDILVAHDDGRDTIEVEKEQPRLSWWIVFLGLAAGAASGLVHQVISRALERWGWATKQE